MDTRFTFPGIEDSPDLRVAARIHPDSPGDIELDEWKNNACPAVIVYGQQDDEGDGDPDGPAVRVWIDKMEEERREFPDARRFTVQLLRNRADGDVANPETDQVETDDRITANATLARFIARLGVDAFVSIEEYPDADEIRTERLREKVREGVQHLADAVEHATEEDLRSVALALELEL